MDQLMNILGSFNPGWKRTTWVEDFVSLLKETVIPSYSFLHVKIEDDQAVFSGEWPQIVAALKGMGLFRLFVPPAYGGIGSSEEDIYLIMELLGYASPGMGVIFVSHGRAVDIILEGNENQKNQYLPRMAEGEFGAIAMTEKGAGSDAGAIGLLAKRNGAGYLLKGEKIFISNSGLANLYTVLVNTKGAKAPDALSLFVVERSTPNFWVKGLPEKDGLKILPTGRLVFRDSPVPEENRVGQEGSGLLRCVHIIDRGKIHIAGICCGLAYRIFREIYRYVNQRQQFDHPLTQSQDISFQLTAVVRSPTSKVQGPVTTE